ncbi:hypothetical protein JB92DRAFT_1435125 [Gautieria morchelliformis]|nr:hypothetical protein JB92DRAFT_1435125 [Gautieria morchelliformis]
MASQQSVDIQVISYIRAVTYVDVAALALVAYDTLLTLPSEITYIWHRKVRLGSVLYLLARYPIFLMGIIGVYTDTANVIMSHSSSVCNSLMRLQDCLVIVALPGIEGLLWARIYAMSHHNRGMRWMLGALCLLLHMGSLGALVVCMHTSLFFKFKSATNLSSNAIRYYSLSLSKINATPQLRIWML